LNKLNIYSEYQYEIRCFKISVPGDIKWHLIILATGCNGYSYSGIHAQCYILCLTIVCTLYLPINHIWIARHYTMYFKYIWRTIKITFCRCISFLIFWKWCSKYIANDVTAMIVKHIIDILGFKYKKIFI